MTIYRDHAAWWCPYCQKVWLLLDEKRISFRVEKVPLNAYGDKPSWFTRNVERGMLPVIQGNNCAQVFTNGNFTTVYPLVLKGKVAQALTEFADDVGIPDTLLSDGAPEMVGTKTEFMKEVNRLKIRLKRSKVGQSNQNYAAEREIVKLQKGWWNRMLKRKVPPRLWDYGLVYETNILNRIPRGREQHTGIEIVTGETPDISEWLDFKFYNWVWYYNQKKIEIDGIGRCLARWLGVAHRVGSNLYYWLLLKSGKVIAPEVDDHKNKLALMQADNEAEKKEQVATPFSPQSPTRVYMQSPGSWTPDALHRDQSPNTSSPTGKRPVDERKSDDGNADAEAIVDKVPTHSPEVRKCVDLKRNPQKPSFVQDVQFPSPLPMQLNPLLYKPWTPDTVSTVYPDNPHHPLHFECDGPSDNEHEGDTVMSGPSFSPYYASQTDEMELEDRITPTQLEDIYIQHDASLRVNDSSQLKVDPRAETREAPQSPKTGDKPLPTQATPVEEIDPNCQKEGC